MSFAHSMTLLFALGVGTVGCTLQPKTPPLAAEAALASFSIDSNQGKLSSTEALQNGPLVVLFYRGHW